MQICVFLGNHHCMIFGDTFDENCSASFVPREEARLICRLCYAGRIRHRSPLLRGPGAKHDRKILITAASATYSTVQLSIV